MNKIRNLFITQRFYIIITTVILLSIVGHFIVVCFVLAQITLGILATLLLVDGFLLFQGNISASREMANRFSNGDENKVQYNLKSTYPIEIRVQCVDELPAQFQIRDEGKFFTFTKQVKSHDYSVLLRPVTRGSYHFGSIQILATTSLGLLSRRFKESEAKTVAVYPSFAQLQKTELLAFSKNRQQTTQKRQLPGNSKEFDQIKEYVMGDDYRKLNWKASARFNKLMVNEYQEECSLHVYQCIDMGRTMRMPFEGMTLLDYAINASLSVANIILKKQDNSGLLTYSTKVHDIVKSDNRRLQINHILETLYNQETRFEESNIEQVYSLINKHSQGRSLLIFYTNFETTSGLERQLPLLKKLADRHLVLVVSFINTKLEELIKSKANNTEEVYTKALAENHRNNHDIAMEKLTQYGILNMKVQPKELTMGVINRYLEIKDRGVV